MAETMESQANHWFLEKNPLLEKLPIIDSLDQLVKNLTFNPLQGLDVTRLSFLEREQLLVMEKLPINPTTQALRVAITILGMLYGSLKIRNPIRVANRRAIWEILNAAATSSASIPPGNIGNTSVQVLTGITGTGKTALIRRICNLLPDKIVHSPCEEAGWQRMTQLVYLYVGMAHDGTRGGFLAGILTEVDRVLGTEYRIDLPKKHRTVERLSVATVAVLHAHYTGIIFVDEGQLRNLVETNNAELMQLFLLGLINAGIPLVLIGNPLAFGWIEDFSQDLRRMYERPIEFVHPAGALDSEENGWAQIFLGVSDYYVLPESFSNKDQCSAVLKKCSGGIPGIALSLWCNTQLKALHSGKAFITALDIESYYSSPDFDELRDLASGFANRDIVRLTRCRDIPVHYYAKAWGKSMGTESSSSTAVNPVIITSEQKVKRRPSSASRFKREQKRKENREKVRQEVESTLQNLDVRKDGVTQILLAGLAGIEKNSRE